MEQQNRKYKVWWDDELDIGRNEMSGHIDDQIAEKFVEENLELAKDHLNALWLIDLTNISKMNAKARKILSDMAKQIKAKKAAFYGASTIVRVIVNMIMAFSGKSQVMKHFATEKEALKWLKERPLQQPN